MKAFRKVVAGFLVAAAVAYAAAASAGGEPRTYDLAVSLDVERARLIGTATVDVLKGAELSIERGDLRILSISNGGKRIPADLLPSGSHIELPRASA